MPPQYYKKLKSEVVLNLFSNNAIKETNSAGRYTNFTWNLPYSIHSFGKNVECFVASVSYENVDAVDDNAMFVFRCPEVNTEEVYDSYRGNGAIIYHSRGFSNENNMNNPKFKMIQPLNKITINISNSLSNRDQGVNTGDYFIITLVLQDYEIIEVQPEATNLIENYHKYPQMKIIY
jgi:hypothetical protein